MRARVARVPRVDTARRIFTYTADTVAIFFALIIALQKLAFLVVQESGFAWRAALAGVCLLGVYAFYWRLHRASWREGPTPTRELVLSGLLAAVAVGFSPYGGEFAAIIWYMAAVLLVPRRIAIGLGVLVVMAPIAYIPVVFDDFRSWPLFFLNILLMGAWTAVLAGLMLALRWAWRLTREFHAGQEARAKLAVSEERLRFARDLHDLLGHSLSVISLKSELAGRLGARDPERAATEMAEVRRLAADALKEVRAAVRGYRAIDLHQELTGCRSVLEAAGVRCTVEAEPADLAGLSAETRTLLAWAVREGVTNVLKHSTATRCLLTIRDGVLEIRNDGAGPVRPPGLAGLADAADSGPAGSSGSGLHGLSERLATAGGGFRAGATGTGEFLLRAVVPT